jgi:hypothetical protein
MHALWRSARICCSRDSSPGKEQFAGREAIEDRPDRPQRSAAIATTNGTASSSANCPVGEAPPPANSPSSVELFRHLRNAAITRHPDQRDFNSIHFPFKQLIHNLPRSRQLACEPTTRISKLTFAKNNRPHQINVYFNSSESSCFSACHRIRMSPLVPKPCRADDMRKIRVFSFKSRPVFSIGWIGNQNVNRPGFAGGRLV